MTRRRPVIEPLEPRILYSADAGLALGLAAGASHDPQEVALVDARTPDYARLLEDIAAQSGRRIEAILIDAEEDGLAQVAAALAGREDLAAVHIIAHGDAGVLQLGSGLVTAEALERHADVVAAWGKSLTADGDILLYGCDVAATAQGQSLVETLARLTGADVGASTDATGHESLGGDWSLEYATGLIDAPIAITGDAQGAWLNLLADVVLTSYEPAFGNLADNAYEIVGGTSYVQSFSYTSGAGSYTVNQIDLVLYKNLTTSGGNVNVQLRDAPSGGNLLASGSVSRIGLDTAEGWAAASLSAPATLTDGTTYYIRIQGTGPGDVFVGIDDAGSYAGGSLLIDGVPQPGRDMAFRVVASDAPVVDLNGGDIGQDAIATFTEQTPVPIAAAATLTDPDSPNLTSLAATLLARPDGDAVESLSLNGAAAAAASAAGLGVTYNPATGELLISGSASLAIYQSILQGIQYGNTSDAPATGDREITVVASDGSAPSVPHSSFVSVVPVNDAPVLAGANDLDAITEDPAANPGTLVSVLIAGQVSDVDAAALSGIAITGVDSANGSWEYSVDGGGTWQALDGATEASARLLAADAQTYVRFVPGADFNGTVSAGITFRAWDLTSGIAGGTADASVNGGASAFSVATASSSISVAAVNDAPVLNIGGAAPVFVEGNNAPSVPVAVASALAVSDVDGVPASATVSITGGFQPAEDVLLFASSTATMGNITGAYDAASGLLSLSSAGATATLAQWEAALRSIAYTNSSETPDPAARTVTFVVHDGLDASAPASASIAISPVNDSPTLAVSGATSFTPGAGPITLDPALVAADADDPALASATISISGGFLPAEDLLVFSADPATMGNIAGTYDAATGVLTLSSAGATATLAQWQAALASVTYDNTGATPSGATRAVSFVVSDGVSSSPAVTQTVTFPAAPASPPAVAPVPPAEIPVAESVPEPPMTAPTPVPTPTPLPVPTPDAARSPGSGASPGAAAGGEEVLAPLILEPTTENGERASSAAAGGTSAETNARFRVATYSAAPTGEEALTQDLLASFSRTNTSAPDAFAESEHGRAGPEEQTGEAASLREMLGEGEETQQRGAVVLAAGSLSVTLAYLLWLLRGGALAASVLAAMPAWRLLDPLPILSRLRNDEEEPTEEEDDEAIAAFDDVPPEARRA